MSMIIFFELDPMINTAPVFSSSSIFSPQLLEFYERVSGARMHANYVRPGGVYLVSPYCDIELRHSAIHNHPCFLSCFNTPLSCGERGVHLLKMMMTVNDMEGVVLFQPFCCWLLIWST